MSIFKKGQGLPGQIDLAAISRTGVGSHGSLPAIRPPNSGSQTDRSTASLRPGGSAGLARPPAGNQTDRQEIRTSANGGQGGRAVRREGLDKLEEKWMNRKPPKSKEILVINDETEGGQLDGLRQLLADLPDDSRREEALRLLEMLGAPAPPASRPETCKTEKTDDDEHEREMAALAELMASNNVDAAEEKLGEIIKAAEADGHIDEDEQTQIDGAKHELEEMKKQRADAEKAIDEAKAKAELVALIAANDVDAAEKKLKEIIDAALEDGNVDEDEQRQIDQAQRELDKLKVRKAAMDKKTARMQAAKGGVGFGKEREEKMQISAAQRETAAERLRLATELRELKEVHAKLRSTFAKLKTEKANADETLAATVVEGEGLRQANTDLQCQVVEQQSLVTTLTSERDELKKELKAQTKLARARATQLEELNAAVQASNGRWQKENDILFVKEQRASQQATEMATDLTNKSDECEKFTRDNRRLDNSLKLEAQAAQLERSTCDKFRVRCVDMEDKWSRAVADRDHHNARSQQLEAELADTQHHLDEASMWHYARVAGRDTTRSLLAMPPETQEINMSQCQLDDNGCIMVAEFLINNLMIVSCDLSRNNFGPKGATALSQALSSNRVLTSLSIKDNAIGPEGAEKLASMLHSNQTIERLNLMGCMITDEGAEALSSALTVSTCNMQLLALRYNDISDRGCRALSQALEDNTTLTELGLNNNNITDDGVAGIAQMLTKNGTLSLLRLTECPIGRESLKRLTNSKRPGLHLYF